MTDEEIFALIFRGYEKVYGMYTLNGQERQDGKLEGDAKTWRGVPDWKAHLDGKKGLGILPLMEDCNVCFSAIDIDLYIGLDFNFLEKIVPVVIF